jgi:hypothetical protein
MLTMVIILPLIHGPVLLVLGEPRAALVEARQTREETAVTVPALTREVVEVVLSAAIKMVAMAVNQVLAAEAGAAVVLSEETGEMGR